ncbi:MAG: CmcJ/NvfI family oxidoreductase [Pseudomonadota bacterium]
MREPAFVNYHLRMDERQAFRFDVDGIVGNLESPELQRTEVAVEDLRRGVSSVDFDTDGIIFENHRSGISDFESSTDWESLYNDELTEFLQDRIGAKDVLVFDHTVRVDDPDAARKPARNVHNDYSESGATQRVIDLVGESRARDYEAGHYAFVNVWRPVEKSIQTSPLGFIRPSSVEAEDWMTIDLIYPDRIGQILGVAANTQHDWFYCSEMTPDEVAVFNIYDNRGRPFLGHSALDMKATGSTPVVRKSIESRTLIRFE